MKIFKTVFKFVAISLMVVGLNAANFEEGKDYVKLDNPIPNAQNTLIKVFSYDCPFCYKYDKSVTPEVVKTLPSSVEYKVFHLKTKGKYGTQASQLFATAIAKDKANGIKSLFDDKSQFKKAKMAYYEAYHDKKERWDGGEAVFLKTGLDASGLTEKDLEDGKNNPEVQAMLNAWEQSLEVAKIQGVPAYVVNGKYLIYTKTIPSAKGYLDLIKELLKKK